MVRNYPYLLFQFLKVLIRVEIMAPPTFISSPPYGKRFHLRVRNGSAHHGHPTVLCLNNEFLEP